ncbi:MAG: hypothetical protein ACXADH_01345 [Candidatus Kariarchaeaceae archaeon]|jgi:magnesium-transporting ATPase (P-type)
MDHTITTSGIQKLEQATYREYLRDGLMEIFVGLLFIVTPGLLLNPPFTGLYVVLAILIFPKVMERIRGKYTYPRLGYAKLKTDDDVKKNFLGALAFLSVVIVITVLILLILSDDPTNYDNVYKMGPFFYGMILFGPAAFLVEKSGLRRFWFYWLLALVSGFIITLLSVDNDSWGRFEGFFLFLGFWGIILVVFGVIVFLRFLQEYPRLAGEYPVTSDDERELS